METQHLKIIFGILICTLVLPGSVQALQLGSVIKNNHVYLDPGERAEFRILMWTVEDNSYPVKLSQYQIFNGYNVVIFPQEFILNKTPEGETETMILPGIETPIHAKVITVYVDTPTETIDSRNDIVIKAIAGDRTGNISVLQERTFLLTVDYEEEFEQPNDNSINKLLGDVYKGVTGFFLNQDSGSVWISIILILIIIYIAWRVYKYE